MTTGQRANRVHQGRIKQGSAHAPPKAPLKGGQSITEIWFIRHGETLWNRARRLQGWQDIALNDTGRRQAQALAQRLADAAAHAPFAALYSSPLARALQTAQPTAMRLGLTIQSEPALRERRFGVLEGIPLHEIAQRAPEAAAVWRRRDPDEPLEGGESLGQFQARIVAVAETIAHRHPGERVLAVTHGGALDIIWRTANRVALSAPHPPPLPNASINRIGITAQGQWHMLDWADVAHVDIAVLDEIAS